MLPDAGTNTPVVVNGCLTSVTSGPVSMNERGAEEHYNDLLEFLRVKLELSDALLLQQPHSSHVIGHMMSLKRLQ